MVRYETLFKAIEDYVIKCEISLKKIREAISPTIKEITDSEEEYNILMENIPRYFQKHYKLKHETILLQDYDGKQYADENGERNTVQTPQEVKDIDEGLLFSFHNHPNDCCFQSLNDFLHIYDYGIKYGMSVAKDGIFISKNVEPKNYFSTMTKLRINNAYTNYMNGVIKAVKKHRKEEYAQLKKDFNEGLIDSESADKKLTQFVLDYLTENSPRESKKLTNRFEKNDVPISTNYIPIS